MRFKKKTVLVTGAGQNTGLEIAAAFAREGAVVFVNDRSAGLARAAISKLRKRGLKRLHAVPADISIPEQVAEMFGRIQAHTTRLDVLVNNAAHLGVGPGFLDTTPELFQAVISVNLLGTFNVSHHAANLMAKHGGGAIVHISSNVSTRAIHHRSAYIASKGAIDALTLAMAVDLGRKKIRVNAVAPGYIHTDRWAKLPVSTVRRRRSNVPLAQEAAGADIAEAVLFLASAQAANITGARLVVDGGCSAQHMPADVDV